MAKIKKLRHGQEISGAFLNDIITIINDLDETLVTSKEWNDTIKKSIEGFQSKLDSIEGEYRTVINTMPHLQELLATFIKAKKSGVSWTEGNQDTANRLAELISELKANTWQDAEEFRIALEEYLNDHDTNSSSLNIFRGVASEIVGQPRVDKQILLDKTNGNIYIDEKEPDGTIVRVLYGNGDSGTEAQVLPEISIVYSETYDNWCWKVGETEYDPTDIPVKGQRGAQGVPGVEGARGAQGLQGPVGPPGPGGPQGNAGAKAGIVVRYAQEPNINMTSDYNGQEFMGFWFFEGNRTEQDVLADPDIFPVWVKVKADIFFPFTEKDNDKLFFTTNPTTEQLDSMANGIEIKGNKGDTGDIGPVPIIYFTTEVDGEEVELKPTAITEDGNQGYKFPVETFQGPAGKKVILSTFDGIVSYHYEGDTSSSTPLFTLDEITGPAGEAGEQGQQGIKGDKGDTGKTGLHITNAFIDGTTLKVRMSDDSLIEAGTVVGPKGDPGDPAIIQGIHVNIIPPEEDGYGFLTLVDANNNTHKLNLYVPRGYSGNPGPDGPPGEDGPQGPMGPGVNILGSLSDTTDLPADFSNPEDLGKGYLIEGYFWLYIDSSETGSINGFENMGHIRGPKGEAGPSGTDGVDGQKLQVRVDSNNTRIEYKYENENDWLSLIALSELKGDKGEDGEDGTPIEVHSDGTNIQWKYTDSTTWTNIVPLIDLKGPQGDDGYTPVKGVDYFDGEDGEDGTDGREVELAGELQSGENGPEWWIIWKYLKENTWNNLIKVEELAHNGESAELQVADGYIQWKLEESTDWENLIALSELEGPPGESIKGDDGPRGSRITSSTSNPTSDSPSNPILNDQHINTNDGSLWVRGSSTWNKVTDFSMIGKPGEDGDNIKGDDGEDGSILLSGNLLGTGTTDQGFSIQNSRLQIAWSGTGTTDKDAIKNASVGDTYYNTSYNMLYRCISKGSGGSDWQQMMHANKLHAGTRIDEDTDNIITITSAEVWADRTMIGDLYFNTSNNDIFRCVQVDSRTQTKWQRINGTRTTEIDVHEGTKRTAKLKKVRGITYFHINIATIGESGAWIATLPEGFRPSRSLTFPASHGTGIPCVVRMYSDGVVKVFSRENNSFPAPGTLYCMGHWFE